MDEFTSVIDRQVAKIASHTIQKTIRRAKRQFVGVACHYDIVDWLQPDWIIEPHNGTMVWRQLEKHPPLAASSDQSRKTSGGRFGSITI